MTQINKITDGIESTQATAIQNGFIGWSPDGPTIQGLSGQRGRNHALPNSPNDETKQYYRGNAGQGDPGTAVAPS